MVCIACILVAAGPWLFGFIILMFNKIMSKVGLKKEAKMECKDGKCGLQFVEKESAKNETTNNISENNENNENITDTTNETQKLNGKTSEIDATLD